MKIIKKIEEKLNSDKHFFELIKGSGTAFSLNILIKASGYLFTLIITRTLGAKAWGIYALSFIVLQIASMVGKLGIDTALLRFIAEYKAQKNIKALKEIYKKSINIVFPFSIFVAITVYFLSPTLSDKVFSKPFLTNYFRLISLIIIPFVIYTIHLQIIRSLKKIKNFMMLQLSNSLLSIFLFLCGILIIKSYYLPIVSYGLATLILAGGSVVLWKKYLSELCVQNPPASQSHPLSYKEIFSVSIPLLLSTSLLMIMSSTDTLMLGIFRNMQEIGIYNVALKLSMLTSIVLMAINTIAGPKFAEFYGKQDYKSLQKMAYQSTKLIFWLSTPIIAILLIFPEQCLMLFGHGFKKGALILVILSIGQFINALTGSVGLILMMTGKHIVHRNIMLTATIGNFFLNLILINQFGVLGAAIATTFTLSISNLTSMFYVKKYYGFYTMAGIWK